MSLKYKNFSTDHILKQARNIRYANGNMMFGFYNSLELDLEVKLDAQQLFIQADVFARQILLHRSLFDLKRFLGQYQSDWQRILMEAYVYDRLKAIYYGVNSINMLDWPKGLVSFPGNIILSRVLSKNAFIHNTNDSQPFSLNMSIYIDNNLENLFKQIFEICPRLKQGFSTRPGVYTYVNSESETVLRGLFNAKVYLKSKGNNGKFDLFDIHDFDTDTLDTHILRDSFALANGVMHKDFKKWFFYLPESSSEPAALRFNESIFLGRALGITMSNNLDVSGNNMYSTAARNYISDAFTRDEVYSVTAVKSELTPYTMDEIKHYLNINSYEVDENNENGDNGGDTSTTP
jgi:hypothetical protein